MTTHKTIAIIALSYLGVPLVGAFDKNRISLGFEINKASIQELQSGWGCP